MESIIHLLQFIYTESVVDAVLLAVRYDIPWFPLSALS